MSWNTGFEIISFKRNCCRPLREVVSWNTTLLGTGCRIGVDLFVRSWVEMPVPPLEYPHTQSTSSWGRELKWFFQIGRVAATMSTSSWGRELKYKQLRKQKRSLRRPLREVVSWNTIKQLEKTKKSVDLFVRSWVEMTTSNACARDSLLSTSSWGRELKFDGRIVHPDSLVVDLFVRSWVEM